MTIHHAVNATKNSEKACNSEVGSDNNFVTGIHRSHIDSHVSSKLENFSWIAKLTRELPSHYCESVIAYLKKALEAEPQNLSILAKWLTK